jgi:hypothetical protein
MEQNEFEYQPEELQAQIAVPEDFVDIGTILGAEIDRRLGYRGEERYVIFYYEPRGQEIIWQDCRSYGFALGGWRTFMRHVEPVMETFDVSIGNAESHGRHVLVVDRLLGIAYVAPRESGERFVAKQSREE